MVSTGWNRSLSHQAWKRWSCRHIACLSHSLLPLACYDAEATISHPHRLDRRSCKVTAIALQTMSLYLAAQYRSVLLDLAYIDTLLLEQLSHAIATLMKIYYGQFNVMKCGSKVAVTLQNAMTKAHSQPISRNL